MERLRAHNLLTFKVDVSVWDGWIALIALKGGGGGSLYTQKFEVISIVNSPDAETSHPELPEERQGPQFAEDGRTEGNHILLGHNQGCQLMNEMGHESYQDSQIRESGYQAGVSSFSAGCSG